MNAPFHAFARFVTPLVAFIAATALGQGAPQSSRADQLARICEELESARQSHNIPGMSLAVVVDDEVVLARGFGTRDLAADLPADEHTVYAIGSITKSFTSAVIAMLVEDGVMKWRDPVREHIPDFELKDPKANQDITIRDLLCHRSGLMRTDLLWVSGNATWDDIRQALARAEPRAVFGRKFNYQNPMYLAAGVAAGNAASSDWSTLVRERIIEPLGMRHSTTSITMLEQESNLATGYEWSVDEQVWRQLPMRNLDVIAPAGAINSDVVDMAQWVRFQLARGRIDDTRLLPIKSFDTMWTSSIEMTPQVTYALGWMLRMAYDRQIIEHGGGIDGFSSHLAFMPDENIGYVLLTNLSNAGIDIIADEIVFGTLLGKRDETPVDADERADEPIDPAYEPYLGEYVANFGSFHNARFEVVVQNGQLAVDVPGQQIFKLRPPADDDLWEFVIDSEIKIKFVHGFDGTVTRMQLYQAGFNFSLPRVGVESSTRMASEELRPYTGAYKAKDIAEQYLVREDTGALAINVPGDREYKVHAPDDKGRWYFHASDDLFLVFQMDEAGDVTGLMLNKWGMELPLERVGDTDPLPDVQTVMRFVHRQRGADAYSTFENVRMTGTVDFANQGITGTVVVLAAGYDRFAQLIDLGIYGSIRRALSNREAWEHPSFSVFVELRGDEQEQMRLEHPALLLGRWEETFDEITVAGRETIDDQTAWVVVATRGSLPPMRLFIDTANGELVRSDSALFIPGVGSVPVRVKYSDYRDVSGVRFPFRIVTENEITGRLVTKLDKIEPNVELHEDPFNLTPPDPLPTFARDASNQTEQEFTE